MTLKVSVIGAGPGGYSAAIRAAKLGAEVTIIEKDNVGGTCLNRGCIPSKIMKTSAEMFEKIHRAKEFGIDINGKVLININAIMTRKQKIIESQRQGINGLLEQNKVRCLKGKGRLKSHGLIEVEHDDGTTTVPYDRLIIATGSLPCELPFIPFDGKNILSSNDILELKEIPESLLIIGGGVIGCEFASILSAMGSKVTIVEHMDRLLPLPSIDKECSKVLQREMKKRQIKVITRHSVENIVVSADKIQASIVPVQKSDHKESETQIHTADKVLVCTGRTPDTSELGLETCKIKTDINGWIKTDAHMKTSVKDIFSIGDALGPSNIMLAHVATAEGNIAAENALGHITTMNYNAVPTAIFTIPEIACVGLSSEQAISQGSKIINETFLFRKNGKAQAIGEIEGHVKITSDRQNGTILGISIIGPHATDLIAEGTIILNSNNTAKGISKTIHAHPTLSESIYEASLKILEKT